MRRRGRGDGRDVFVYHGDEFVAEDEAVGQTAVGGYQACVLFVTVLSSRSLGFQVKEQGREGTCRLLEWLL